jgi:hypothetical protein
MRHPLWLLLLTLSATRCAGAPCDPSSDHAYDLHLLTPPALGGTFVSCFGRRIERLTDHDQEHVAYIYAEYATQNHINADGTVVKLEFPDGTVHLLERATRHWLEARLLKAQSPVWHPTDASLLLYVDDNEIRRLDIHTGKSTSEFRADDYRRLESLGEDDISPDGNKLVFRGTTRRGERHIVVYHRDRKALSDGHLDITDQDVNWIHVTNNRVLVGYNQAMSTCAPDIPEAHRYYDRNGRLVGCAAVRVFGTDLQTVWPDGRTLLAPYWGHGDVGVDQTDGGREVWVMSNSNVPVPDPKRFGEGSALPPESCWNSLVRFTLDRPSPPTCLRESGGGDQAPAFSWDLAMHVALPGKPSKWAYVTLYRTQGDTQYEAVEGSSAAGCHGCTVPFQNEIIRVRLDGHGVERLAQHQSSRYLPGDNSYVWTPRASVDYAGRWVLFNSNFGVGESALATDVYLLELPGN